MGYTIFTIRKNKFYYIIQIYFYTFKKSIYNENNKNCMNHYATPN